MVPVIITSLLHADDEASRRGSCTESRMQRLRWVAQTIAEHGGHKYIGATDSCPLLHALNTTKKQLDSLDADMAALDSELERARLCLQAGPVPCCLRSSCAWPSSAQHAC